MGIIPAYAGSTTGFAIVRFAVTDHPRIRGEHAHAHAYTPSRPGSSPHTRGAPIRHPFCHCYPGIIPAYAGSTFSPICTREKSRDHPRIRGEHVLPHLHAREVQGSSPHTRGALSRSGAFPLAVRIIPAYAGSTPTPNGTTRRGTDHPRIRGEHVAGIPGKIVKAGSSPHTRGALLTAVDVDGGGRIIPAYAGSTRKQYP